MQTEEVAKQEGWYWRDESVVIVLALAPIGQAFMGFTLRALYSDGAYFVTQMASSQAFVIPGRARWMSTILYELPTLMAIKLGMDTPSAVAMAYSIATNALPGAVFLLCRAALPATEVRYFVFPAFVYFAGTLSAQFASTVEGLIAIPILWLLFHLIVFGSLHPMKLCLILLLYNAASLFFPVMIVVLLARSSSRISASVLMSFYVRAIVLVLGMSVSLWHVQATEKSSEFTAEFRSMLASHSGIIPAGMLLNSSSLRVAQLAKKMIWVGPITT